MTRCVPNRNSLRSCLFIARGTRHPSTSPSPPLEERAGERRPSLATSVRGEEPSFSYPRSSWEEAFFRSPSNFLAHSGGLGCQKHPLPIHKAGASENSLI